MGTSARGASESWGTNAVADALREFGVEPRALPLSPPAVWRMIAEGRTRSKQR